MIKFLLKTVINFQLKTGIFKNHGAFVAGDVLIYNWKAKIMIDTAIKNKLYPRTVRRFLYNGENVEFTDDDSCSVYWQRKATKKEILNYKESLIK